MSRVTGFVAVVVIVGALGYVWGYWFEGQNIAMSRITSEDVQAYINQ